MGSKIQIKLKNRAYKFRHVHKMMCLTGRQVMMIMM
jgi:hypothetical protein